MGKYPLIFLFFVLFLTYSAGSVYAQEYLLTDKDAGAKEACSLIKDNLQRGVDAKAVTKDNIQLGNNACYVIKCVIDGGGELKSVISGAMEAGCTTDVVTKCCMDAGVEPGMIAQIFQSTGRGLEYSLPMDELIPFNPAPRGNSAGRFISPSSF